MKTNLHFHTIHSRQSFCIIIVTNCNGITRFYVRLYVGFLTDRYLVEFNCNLRQILCDRFISSMWFESFFQNKSVIGRPDIEIILKNIYNIFEK